METDRSTQEPMLWPCRALACTSGNSNSTRVLTDAQEEQSRQQASTGLQQEHRPSTTFLDASFWVTWGSGSQAEEPGNLSLLLFSGMLLAGALLLSSLCHVADSAGHCGSHSAHLHGQFLLPLDVMLHGGVLQQQQPTQPQQLLAPRLCSNEHMCSPTIALNTSTAEC